MKKSLYPFLCIICLLFHFENARATHLIGSDAAWKCLGNDTFEITLNVYRRCTDGASGLSLPSLPPTLTSDSCGNALTVSMGTVKSYTVTDITPLCIGMQLLCPISGGTGTSTASVPVGLEKHTVVYKVYLGGNYANCCWYKLYWQLCCRNSNITTGYADADYYNYFWLNRCVINSSPRFTSTPLIFRNTSQNVKFNMGMVDDENDSLTYSLSPPLGGSYASPWSADYPLTCLGGNNPNPNASPPTGFNLNQRNGDISFTPVQVQITAMKVTVREWRKIAGVAKVIGTTSRDMQFAITQANVNALPTLSGPFNYNICPGSKFCFTIDADDANTADTTRISSTALQSIAGSTFTTTPDSVQHASGTFCWTPDSTAIPGKNYIFYVRGRDLKCPIPGETYAAYTITVIPDAMGTTKMEKVNCDEYNFKSYHSNPFAHTQKWVINKGAIPVDSIFSKDSVMNYKFTTPGTYYIKNYPANVICGNIITDTIVITNASQLSLQTNSDTTICPGATITLKTIPLTGLSPYFYKWTLNGSVVSTVQSFNQNPVINSRYIVEVLSSNACVMSKTDTIDITVDTTKLRVLPLADTIVCAGTVLNFTPTIKTGKAPFQYQWFKSGTQVSTSASLMVTAGASAMYSVKIVSDNQCDNIMNDTFLVGVFPLNQLILTTNNTTITPGQVIIIRSNSKGNSVWSGNNIIGFWNDSIMVQPATNTTYKLLAKNASGCTDSAEITITISHVGIRTNSLSNTSKLQIYPNPAGNNLSINATGIAGIQSDQPFEICNVLGQILISGTLNEGSTTVAISSLADGVYVVRVNGSVGKFMKKN